DGIAESIDVAAPSSMHAMNHFRIQTNTGHEAEEPAVGTGQIESPHPTNINDFGELAARTRDPTIANDQHFVAQRQDGRRDGGRDINDLWQCAAATRRDDTAQPFAVRRCDEMIQLFSVPTNYGRQCPATQSDYQFIDNAP